MAVRMVQSVVPEVVLVVRSGPPVTVFDRTGQGFLRVGRRGVEANLAAPAYYRSGDPSGVVRPPRGVPAGAPARWRRISRHPVWAFFDGRTAAGVSAVPPAVRAAHRPRVLAQWAIPVRVGARAAQLRGLVLYRPPVGGAVAALRSPLHPVAGVTVALTAATLPDLFVSVTHGAPLLVRGADGEPFAEIGPHRVRVNLRSPTHAADAAARGEPVGVRPDAAAAPRWRTVSAGPSYDWLEPRARAPAGLPSPAVLEAGHPTMLSRWSVPMRRGGVPVDVRGVIRWVPTAGAPVAVARGGGSSGAGVWLGVAMALLVGAGAGVGLRRRRVARADPG